MNQIIAGIVFYIIAGFVAAIVLGKMSAKSAYARSCGKRFITGELNISYAISGVTGVAVAYLLFFITSTISGWSVLKIYPVGLAYLFVLMPVWFLGEPYARRFFMKRYIARQAAQ